MQKRYGLLIGLAFSSALWGAARSDSATQRVRKQDLFEPPKMQEYTIKENGTQFVIVIPSYNNAQWYRCNLMSVFMQKYDNYRVIYIDDCSSDETGDLVQQYLAGSKWQDRFTLIRNTDRVRAMANIYKAVHMCDDHEVVVMLDGDDWLAHEHVLKTLNEVYANPQVWLTFGSFLVFNGDDHSKGWAAAIPGKVVRRNAFRYVQPAPGHLRTFYAGLFKKIDVEDLYENGTFYEYTYDLAMMFPMLEMAGERFEFISQNLYIYNGINSISDHNVGKMKQRKTDLCIRAKERYRRIDYLFDEQKESEQCI